jgi:hypothetical protein
MQVSCHLLLPGGSMGPDMFCNFYLVKDHKIAKKSKTNKTREREKIDVCLTKFKNNNILQSKVSHIFLLTTKLYTG